ncbi:hypothetical protein EIP91_001700 [Steccherinum ochraceum]|uniref:F-box domain-containing protein n=1 Tax=Steccherinum ochraceum TaxID=92696 RepID=A0A4R0RFW0_9APHY|nr:hypothetical protein EIP91_001700 [Steccherinum ochraceum]
MATFSSLPNELLLLIFSEAAADVSAGPIATTVGLVCKSFHSLVEFHGIDVLYTFLREINSIRTFLDILLAREVAQKQIHSLLMTIGQSHEGFDENFASCENVIHLMTEILSNIDPSHLHTLFIYLPSCYHNGSESPMLNIPVPLPALTTLHLSNIIPAPPAHPPCLFLKLSHLSLSQLSWSDREDIPHVSQVLAPRSTQLKLTFRAPTGHCIYTLALQLDAYLRMKNPQETKKVPNRIPLHVFPTHLAHITVGFYIPGSTLGRLATPLKTIKFLVTAAWGTRNSETNPVHILPTVLEEEEGPQEERFVRDWMKLNVGEENVVV